MRRRQVVGLGVLCAVAAALFAFSPTWVAPAGTVTALGKALTGQHPSATE